ncbi:hypothetical protein AKJ09_09312 [Labilithrix luteola]|uniref:Uncharacterized protein n=1 Tax=Labilithrix luteola TaxID=1391654 RepID=A0A0K1QA81_9BACT|nr:hypothetical protein AKJ09_09312 [Labilithrix luteola]
MGADGAIAPEGSVGPTDQDGEAVDSGVDAARRCKPGKTATSICVDFDDTGDASDSQFVTDYFDLFYDEVGDAGAVAFDTTYFTSPQRSGLLELLPGSKTNCGGAQLRASFDNAGKVHLEAAMRVDQAGATDPSIGSTLSIALGNATSGAGCVLGFLMGGRSGIGTQGYLPDGSHPYDERDFDRGMVRSRWYRVVYDVDRTVTPTTLSVSIDGEPKLTNEPLMAACQGPGTAELRLGPNCFGPQATPLQARFDDVFFEVSPP